MPLNAPVTIATLPVNLFISILIANDAFRRTGINVAKLGADLQTEGAKSFDDLWQNFLNAIEAKSRALK